MFPRILANIGKIHGGDGTKPALRLQISAQLSRNDLPAFYRSSSQYIQLIQNAGIYLLLSGWRVEKDIVQFFNYWSIEPDANKLVEAEYTLPDNPDYAKFADLFIDEIKDIAVPINSVRLRPPSNGARYLYLRAQYRVRMADFCEFQAQVEEDLLSFALANEWSLGDVYLGLTGSSTSLVQMWAIPETHAATAAQKLARTRWMSLVTEAPSYQILDPTPSDPVLGSQPLPVIAGSAVATYKSNGI